MSPLLWFIALLGGVTVAYLVAKVGTVLLLGVMAER